MKLFKRAWEALDDRVGISSTFMPVLRHPVPKGTDWFYSLGTMVLFSSIRPLTHKPFIAAQVGRDIWHIQCDLHCSCQEVTVTDHPFIQVDVFTDRIFGGNPLAVFPDGRGIGDAQMQAIAREMNLSETAFVVRLDGTRGGQRTAWAYSDRTWLEKYLQVTIDAAAANRQYADSHVQTELASIAAIPRAPRFVCGMVSFRGDVLVGVEIALMVGSAVG